MDLLELLCTLKSGTRVGIILNGKLIDIFDDEIPSEYHECMVDAIAATEYNGINVYIRR